VDALPNPFNASTQFRYSLPNECQVKLVIYNILGKKVITLIDRHQTPGSWSAIWDGKNEGGEAAPSGVYLYKLDAGNLHHRGKIALLK
jgi:flagellar hook assembly protein FlgD